MRANGATAGATEPERAIWPRLSMYCRQSAKSTDVVGIVLHLIDHGVVFRGGERDGGLDIGRREARQRMLARFERADDAVETR